MTPLDLSDKYVRAMADRNHTPREMWSLGGDLISLHCDECGHRWPCETRQALDALKSGEVSK
jgi:hypothetical protein